MQTYWIVIVGLAGAGKTTFLQQASEFTTERDPHDMSEITPAQQSAAQAWLQRTGNTPNAAHPVPDERQFQRWSRRVTVGGIRIDEHTQVCLYEAPVTHEFDFLWQVMTPEMYLGAVVVLDSTRHDTLREASRLAAAFASYAPEPYVFAANRHGDEYALPVQDLRILLQNLDGHLLPVVPCNVIDRASVQQVLLAFLELIRDNYDDGIAW